MIKSGKCPRKYLHMELVSTLDVLLFVGSVTTLSVLYNINSSTVN